MKAKSDAHVQSVQPSKAGRNNTSSDKPEIPAAPTEAVLPCGMTITQQKAMASQPNAFGTSSKVQEALHIARRQHRLDPLGDFVVSSGRVAVCDPYAIKDELRWVDNVVNGKWQGSVILQDERPFDNYRVAILLAEAKNGNPATPWEQQDFRIPVECATVCICNAQTFLSEANSDNNRFQRLCCRLASRRCGGGIFKWGVASSTGYGDGFYACWVRRDRDGKAVAILVDFDLARGRRLSAAMCHQRMLNADGVLVWGPCGECQYIPEKNRKEVPDVSPQ